MKCVELIYRIIDSKNGTDNFFPILVYLILKANVKNLYLNMIFMKSFTRPTFNVCEISCKHIENTDLEAISCTCTNMLQTKYKEKEINYYLTSLEAAVAFIERMEFNNLIVTQEEYDKNISKYIKDIQINESYLIKQTERKTYFEETKKYLRNFFK